MTKSNNKQVAELIIKESGIPAPNCYECMYSVGNAEIRCAHPFANAVTISNKINPSSQPTYPVVQMFSPSGEAKTLPMVVFDEEGIKYGKAGWPTKFDPLFLLFCMVFTDKNQENSPIDNGS